MSDTLHKLNGNCSAFWGAIGARSWRRGTIPAETENAGDLIWNSEECNVSLRFRGPEGRAVCSWQTLDERLDGLAAFVWGRPFVASDCDFGRDTQVKQMRRSEIPNCVCRLYKKYGTHAFALLEGNFSIVLWDPRRQSVFLAVDKYGCDDVFLRREADQLRFASHAALLVDDAVEFDARAVAFFLGQEGFVPAPFTLWEGIRTVGRARFLEIRTADNGLQITEARYWRPSRSWNLSSRAKAIEEMYPMMERAVETRATSQAGLLLSGGADSALLANTLAGCPEYRVVAITGSVAGYSEGEEEIRRARRLARMLAIDHEEVTLDPFSDALPEEWSLCTESWTGGTRLTLPLFLRLGRRLEERLGGGYRAFSGQMADTLADNNHTLPSMGYRARRLFYSQAFCRALPLLQEFAPSQRGLAGKWLVRIITALSGTREGAMAESLLGGFASRERFYQGRVFGYGEMPGRSKAYFPVLTAEGFERVAGWYSSHFIEPIVSEMRSDTFYHDMIEMSMDMVMLHLDTRLVFHVFRIGGGAGEMPFLDSRVVNFFASLPVSARAFYREPKHIIREQFRRRNLARIEDEPVASNGESVARTQSLEQLLLSGTLGAYFRELLRAPSVLQNVPGLFDYVDESYLFRQLEAFVRNMGGADGKFISRLAALESWSRMYAAKNASGYARATA
ncbi:MAG TPA: asparagine synthase-related protein [Candidatus Acidoferrales bacterium]|nr:asparagine synthase-related protein [Candidatus Acidoferrales bacterium]